MRRRPRAIRGGKGWTLAELLVVLAILSLLAALLVPSLQTARDRAKLTACAAQMRGVHAALMGYAAEHRAQLPPFAFSDFSFDLPLSGHWGGISQPGDPAALGRVGVERVNLWTLEQEGRIAPRRLTCPGADASLLDGAASHFPHSFRYSTYCLRVPYSEDLFVAAPNLAGRGGKLLGIYGAAAGGQSVRVGQYYQTVPLVRTDMDYRIADGVACGDGVYEPATDVMLSDAFWRRDHRAAAPSRPGLEGYPVHSGWCHGEWFNVLRGNGAVRTVRDDGTVEANTIPPGGTLAADGHTCATYAERVWQYFDASR